ncbi:gliding motility-associated C-terminal domain-containing protein [Pontibacter chitinilyticus]|uniref:gliding motility-associated C-terminal domain-containing protein n=1 Tax=Pontibacter chitinilyticus TaxID=2674989 RepID=UPI00321BAE87
MISFEWSNGNTTSTSINVTRSGTYYAKVTDADGCVGTSNKIKVIVNDKLIAPVIQVSGPTTYCESGSVTFSVTPIEGTSYYWRKDGQTINEFKGMTSITVTEPGVYSILETNSCGPAYSQNPTEFVIDHPIPSFSIVARNNLEFCEGDSLVLTAPDIPHVKYVWKKNGIPFGKDSLVQVTKESGLYTVDLINTCGAYTSSNTLKGTLLATPKITEVIDGRGCVNTKITLTAKGGTNGSYRWYTSKESIAISGAVNETFTTDALSKTTTFYVATTNGQCESPRTPVQAIVETPPTAPKISFTGPTTVCSGESVRLHTKAIEGMLYQWKKDGKVISAAQDTVYDAVESGTYTLDINNSCNVTATSNAVKVEVRAPVEPPMVQGSGSCEPTSLTLVAYGGDSNGYRWYDDAESLIPIPNATGSTFVTPKLTATKTYYVSVVRGACESTRVPVQALIIPFPEADAGETVIIEQGKSAVLQGSGGVTYHWEPATDLSDPEIANPVASPKETITYTLTVTNEAGCQDTDEVLVLVEKVLQIPNAFSPNGDGVNDNWKIGNILEFPGVQLKVFDRWGNKIYQNDSYQNEWDGTYRGRVVPVGTYFYIFTLPSKRQLTGYLNVVQ